MILSTPDPTTRAILQLAGAPYCDWHPCGSRFFGDAILSSDFDFFSAYDDRVQNYLARAGFKLRRKADYMDDNTISIFEKGNVHAIFVKSVDLRLKAQKHFIGKPKKYRRSVKNWNKVYAEIQSER